jgi:hypothetical protein
VERHAGTNHVRDEPVGLRRQAGGDARGDGAEPLGQLDSPRHVHAHLAAVGRADGDHIADVVLRTDEDAGRPEPRHRLLGGRPRSHDVLERHGFEVAVGDAQREAQPQALDGLPGDGDGQLGDEELHGLVHRDVGHERILHARGNAVSFGVLHVGGALGEQPDVVEVAAEAHRDVEAEAQHPVLRDAEASAQEGQRTDERRAVLLGAVTAERRVVRDQKRGEAQRELELVDGEQACRVVEHRRRPLHEGRAEAAGAGVARAVHAGRLGVGARARGGHSEREGDHRQQTAQPKRHSGRVDHERNPP